MKPYQKFIAGAAVLGTLAGCAGGYNPTKSFAGGLEKTVVGVPISVEFVSDGDGSFALSSVIKTNDGKYILCSSVLHHPVYDVTDTYALMKAVMKEGIQIKMRVERNNDGRCSMDSVSAYGYTISMRNGHR